MNKLHIIKQQRQVHTYHAERAQLRRLGWSCTRSWIEAAVWWQCGGRTSAASLCASRRRIAWRARRSRRPTRAYSTSICRWSLCAWDGRSTCVSCSRTILSAHFVVGYFWLFTVCDVNTDGKQTKHLAYIWDHT